MIQLAEFTTSTYDVTLTLSSLDSTSSLNYGTESSYTTILRSNASNTYWKSQLEDSRSFTSSTNSSSTSTNVISMFTTTSAYKVSTSSTIVYSNETYKGATYQAESELATRSTAMQSLKFSHTGITSIVSVSVYGNYTTRSTTFSNKERVDTCISYTMLSTDGFIGTTTTDRAIVTLSRTDSWNLTSSYYSTTSDVEINVSRGVKSSIIYTEEGSTYNLGTKYFNISTTSSSRLVATRLSGTVYNSTKTNVWTSTSETAITIPANYISYTAITSVIGQTLANGSTITYFTTLTYESCVNSSSVNYSTITAFPIVITQSVISGEAAYVDEYISYTDISTANAYLYSLTMSIVSANSASTSMSETYSRSWYATRSDSYDYTLNDSHILMTITDISLSNDLNVSMPIPTMTFNGTAMVFTTWTAYGSAVITYSYYYPVYETWKSDHLEIFSYTTYYSSTGSSTTNFSSTTYTGLFDNTLRISTTLSNYTSDVRTDSRLSTNSRLDAVITNSYDVQRFTSYTWERSDSSGSTVWTSTKTNYF